MTLLTPQEVAEMTKLSVDTIQRKAADGTLRATKPAGKWRIYADSVEEWLRNCEPRIEPGVVLPEPRAKVKPSPGGSWRHLTAIEGDAA